MWCSFSKYKSTEAPDVEWSHKYLSQYLFKHFDHRYFILIDDYNRVCKKSIF